jgi:thioredoxin-like negative regulator of GroEL
LGERLNGIQEVVGSIPIGSTKNSLVISDSYHSAPRGLRYLKTLGAPPGHREAHFRAAKLFFAQGQRDARQERLLVILQADASAAASLFARTFRCPALKRKGVTYSQLVEKLNAMGVDEKEVNVRNKLSRG